MVLNRRLFVLLILILVLSFPARAEMSDYVRLHVLAEDDTPEAQTLKLEVRDAVLIYAKELLQDAESAEAAWLLVNAHRDQLEDAARERARLCGFTGEIHCETGVFSFPERWYGGTKVPAGDYRALRVVIGAGEGHNWWCVLYPSLCYPEDWQTGDGTFYSSIWRWLQSLFGGGEA